MLRFAVFRFTPTAVERIESWFKTSGEDIVQVSSTQNYFAQTETLQVLSVAKVALSSQPQRDGTLLVIPGAAREKAESMLEQCANALSVIMARPRSILSPEPYLALQWDSEEEREYLQGSAGFAISSGLSIKSELAIEMSLDNIELLEGRQDGAALLAEGLSQTHSLGKFREYMRFFELAFALPVPQLAKKLAQFLRSGEGGYSMSEVRQWIDLRNPATHAKDGDFVTEAEVRHFIARVEQAAYDVLYNKREWRDAARTRRDVFRPTTWTTSAEGRVAVEQGSRAVFRYELLDGFLAYPLERSVQIVLPEHCWSNAVVADQK